MEKRLLLFVPLAFIIFYASLLIEQQRRAAKLAAIQPAAQENAVPGKDGKDHAAKAAAAGGDKKDGERKIGAENDSAKPDAEKKDPAAKGPDAKAPDGKGPDVGADKPIEDSHTLPEQWFTLGSAAEPDNKTSPYEMLVTLTSRGAAVERIELSSPRYLDIDDRSGYLGNLQLTSDKAGCKINVVGPGTAAAAAGLEAGDVIAQINGEKITASAKAPGDPDQVINALQGTEPKQSIELVVFRGESTKKISAVVQRRPLAVIRPELDTEPLDAVRPGDHDPLSFLLTLKHVDDNEIDAAADKIEGEITGLHLRRHAWEAKRIDADTVEFTRALPRWDLEIVKRYRLAKMAADPKEDKPAYHLTLRLEIRNRGKTARSVAYQLDGPTGLPNEGWWYANRISPDWGGVALRDIAYKLQGNDAAFVNSMPLATKRFDESDAKPDAKKDKKDDGLTKKELDESPLVYAGVDAQYFAAMMLPLRDPPRKAWIAEIRPLALGLVKEIPLRKKTDCTIRLTSFAKTIEPGESLVHEYQIFAGPKQPELLGQYGAPTPENPDDTLRPLVYYGWFRWVAQPMVGILALFYSLVHNYGLAIIMLTVVVRLCMFPLSRKQSLAAKKMQELQPEMKKINEKYKTKPEERTRATQELWRKHNHNPLGGCLLAFVQLPIFMGLYRSLMVNVELRGSSLFGDAVRWCSNLAAPDMFWKWADSMPAGLATYVSSETTGWLGPYLNIFPLITVALFTAQQAMFMPPATDDNTAMQQKIMKYMTLFMGVMFFKVAAGLCLYFIASSIWGMTERTILNRTIKPSGPAIAGATDASSTSPRSQPATNGSNGSAAALRRKQRGKRN